MKRAVNPAQQPVALITGGAKRIGAAIAADLSAHNFAVAVHYDRSAAEADSLCQEIIAKGGRAAPFQADLRRDNPKTLLEKIAAKLGAVALLVNNASLFRDDTIGRLDKRLWDDHFALHLSAPVFLAEAMAEMLAAARPAGARQGLIVNMIDQRVLRLNPHFFSYTLSKAALWTATQTLAQALAPHIRVNAIGPGPSLRNSGQTAADFARQCRALPLRGGPKTAEFGKTIRYLWETPSITGQMLALDGGQHLMWQTPDVKWDKSNFESL